MRAANVFLVLCAAALASRANAGYDWEGVLNYHKLQTGDATYYGQQVDQDEAGTCSYGRNFANTMKLPWTTGVKHTVALNDNMFNNSLPCGTCIVYRGTGRGLGTTPIPTNWTMAIVNNRCPECSFGDIDLNLNGDGRWKVEWHAVPCNVGTSKLHYSIVVSTYYWFSLVVSNTRIPVYQVEVKINDVWVNMPRSSNNQWPYYNTNGPWQTNFPMPIRITSIAGETVEDVITGPTGCEGQVQFSPNRVVRPEYQDLAAAGGWTYEANATSGGPAHAPGPSAPSAPAPAPSSYSPAPSQGNSGAGASQGSAQGGSNQGSSGANQGGSGANQGGGSPPPTQAPAHAAQPPAQAPVQAPAQAPVQLSVTGTPVPREAGSRGTPASQEYTAVGGRRLLRA